MKTRFDLEQEILDCWKVVTDLKDVCNHVMDNHTSTDQIANVLLGMAELYDIKFNKVFETFENCVGSREL